MFLWLTGLHSFTAERQRNSLHKLVVPNLYDIERDTVVCNFLVTANYTTIQKI